MDTSETPQHPRSAASRRGRRAPAAVLLGAALTLVALTASACIPQPTPCTPPPSTTTTTDAAGNAPLALRVSGRNLVDGSGNVVQLRGINRPGTEYRCTWSNNSGFVTADGDGGTTAYYVAAMVNAFRSWNVTGSPGNAINAVRIPLNEDCWLGINGVNPTYSGAAYRGFIRAEVAALVKAGMYPILDLHWSAPGTLLADQQDVGPNLDHSVLFWRQVAATFAGNPAVAFDLFNEPHLWCYTAACASYYPTAAAISWACYRDGCTYGYSKNDHITGRTSGTVSIAGTQRLVNTIRATGASNVILIAGLGYANALDNWMAYRPTDPLNQIAAEIHTYSNSGINALDTGPLDDTLAKGNLSSSVPILVGEFGEWLCGSSTTGLTAATMNWADSHGYSYTAWGWDAGEGCWGPTLVSANSGAPSPYGAIVQAHLRCMQG